MKYPIEESAFITFSVLKDELIFAKMAKHPTFDRILSKEKEMQHNAYLHFTRLSVLFVTSELY